MTGIKFSDASCVCLNGVPNAGRVLTLLVSVS